MDRYEPKDIEPKWQEKWLADDLYSVDEESDKPKKYILEMFPYPSGDLHMGHVRNYAIGDVTARFSTMKGFNVLHPIGWDSFGLPAENAAIKNRSHPRTWTYENIERQRRQMKQLGLSYDWNRTVVTSDPEYYEWGQWIFLKFFERGLVYRAKSEVNWCPLDKTVLANEQVEGGRCWRCQSIVERKELEQWFFKITDYAEQLLNDLELLSGWPDRVKVMQQNWIGRSSGAEVKFMLEETGEIIPVFTTRPDTLFGATFFLLAPEHPLVDKLVKGTEREEDVNQFRRRAASKTTLDRVSTEMEKEGAFTGKYAINPVNGERIPMWIADYVLMEYGTGAVMAVPAHDQRDFEFARKYDLPIKAVIQPDGETAIVEDKMTEAFTGIGLMSNSERFNGLSSDEGVKKVTEWLLNMDKGKPAIAYRLRDWLISRQRYWGNPIPIVYCDNCGTVPVKEKNLPVILPEDLDVAAGGTLAAHDSFVNTKCPECGGPAKRETDTMDTFTCSSWYYLRFCSPWYKDGPFDPRIADYWMPVDQYIGGIEHAVLHLLYARFFTKVFADEHMLSEVEPFENLLTQGMVKLYGTTMSKSKGNVVSPEEIIAKYGADTARMFILFASPPEKDLEWSHEGVDGLYRFLNRIWRLVMENHELTGAAADSSDWGSWRGLVELKKKGMPTPDLDDADLQLLQALHRTIKKVTDDITRFNFNTAISAVMELINAAYHYNAEKPAEKRSARLLRAVSENLLLLLAPLVPHIAEELWSRLELPFSIHRRSWPVYDRELAKTDEVTVIVQVNGKLRDRLIVPRGTAEEKLGALAVATEGVNRHLDGGKVVKVITVIDKLVNVVVK